MREREGGRGRGGGLPRHCCLSCGAMTFVCSRGLLDLLEAPCLCITPGL